jgi:hypothetical protein
MSFHHAVIQLLFGSLQASDKDDSAIRRFARDWHSIVRATKRVKATSNVVDSFVVHQSQIQNHDSIVHHKSRVLIGGCGWQFYYAMETGNRIVFEHRLVYLLLYHVLVIVRPMLLSILSASPIPVFSSLLASASRSSHIISPGISRRSHVKQWWSFNCCHFGRGKWHFASNEREREGSQINHSRQKSNSSGRLSHLLPRLNLFCIVCSLCKVNLVNLPHWMRCTSWTCQITISGGRMRARWSEVPSLGGAQAITHMAAPLGQWRWMTNSRRVCFQRSEDSKVTRLSFVTWVCR